LTIDYSSAKVENQTLEAYLKSRGDDFVRDWPEDQKKAREYFVVRFNKKFKKGMQIVDDGADYAIQIHVNNLDMGNGAAAFFSFSAKGGGVIMSGTVDVLNTKTQARVCSLVVDEVKGIGHMSETVRLGMMFYELANELFDVAKDAKDVPVVEEPASSVSNGSAAMTGSAAMAGAAVAAAPTSAAQPAASAQPTASAKPAKKQTTAKANETSAVATPAPVAAQPAAQPATAPAPAVQTESGIPASVAGARSTLVTRKGEGGSFLNLKSQSRVSLFIDFSEALIDNKSEEDFVTYMQTSARRKDLDEDFASNWSEKVKPQLTATFISKVNEELSDEKQKPRLVTAQGNIYTLKVLVKEISDDGDIEADYLLVETTSGVVLGVVEMETDGGHVGKFVGLLNDGFGNAGEEFGEWLAKKLKKGK
jgi:hypothetical protein